MNWSERTSLILLMSTLRTSTPSSTSGLLYQTLNQRILVTSRGFWSFQYLFRALEMSKYNLQTRLALKQLTLWLWCLHLSRKSSNSSNFSSFRLINYQKWIHLAQLMRILLVHSSVKSLELRLLQLRKISVRLSKRFGCQSSGHYLQID